MSEEKTMRLSQVARKLNVGRATIIEYLGTKGIVIDSNPNSKVTDDQFALLSREFADSASDKVEASSLTIGTKHAENVVAKVDDTKEKEDEEESVLIKNLGSTKEKTPEEKVETPEPVEKIDQDKPKLQGIKVVGKIDLGKKKEDTPKKEEVKSVAPPEDKKEEIPPKKKEEPETPPVKAEKTPEVVKEEVVPVDEKVEEVVEKEEVVEAKGKGDIKDTDKEPEEVKVESTPEEPLANEDFNDVIEAKADKLKGLKVVGKIKLPVEERKDKKDKKDRYDKNGNKGKKDKKGEPVASSDEQKDKKKRPRKRIANKPRFDNRPKKPVEKEEPSDKEIQEKIKATLAKLKGTGKKGSGAKYRREKRSNIAEAEEKRILQEQEDSKVLKVTEFISANDLSSLMDVSVNEVISTCLSLGMFVSINQRLDAEAITIIADEFGYNVEFISTEDEEVDVLSHDDEKDLKPRAPIVTIMGHVDHGKTSLLDFIRRSKVIDQEAGGITQHIGAYDVRTQSGQKIAFLDTPGHEAFTAMRARGAKVTDIVIIVVAADDDVMPQTKEAINHAQVAGVPIVIAINKIDKPNANPDKIKEALSAINILVEDWGGKYQSQEISAKTGLGVDELLEKVLLEAELLELKANPDKPAVGTVIEASLDKGRGYVATILVQAGTLKVGDIMLAGAHYGRVKAMFDHKGTNLKQADPSTPVLVLGLDGAPQAGDKFSVMSTDKEAREIASKRAQIAREQSIRTKKHITLDEIGRRLAIGSFKELNVIVKGDVDGSVEALGDSLLKLSTEEVQVSIIHKGVGQISESDVLLASASDAVIVGFQVRPSAAAKKIAEAEEIEIRLYSIIYDAINDVKDAMEGMLDPEVEEVITGNIEVRDLFKISKIGTVAGCMVTDGYIKKSNPIRIIRDGIVIYAGEIGQLKRFKEDIGEVKSGYECGISVKNFNDIKTGDVIEGYTETEVKRKL